MQPNSTPQPDTHGEPCVDPDILLAADQVRMALRLRPLDLTSTEDFLRCVATLPQFGELLEASYVNPGVMEGGSLYTFRWRVDSFSNTILTLLVPAEGRAQVRATGQLTKTPTIMLMGGMVLHVRTM